MIETADKLNLKVNNYRLMTREELQKFEEQMPEACNWICWWLADADPSDKDYIAYAEGNYTDDDMYCERGEANTHIRVVLDLEGVTNAGLKAGNEFIYRGYVFTLLNETLAISNNFLGCAKYYDPEIAMFMSGEDITCTLDGILGNLLA